MLLLWKFSLLGVCAEAHSTGGVIDHNVWDKKHYRKKSGHRQHESKGLSLSIGAKTKMFYRRYGTIFSLIYGKKTRNVGTFHFRYNISLLVQNERIDPQLSFCD